MSTAPSGINVDISIMKRPKGKTRETCATLSFNTYRSLPNSQLLILYTNSYSSEVQCRIEGNISRHDLFAQIYWYVLYV